MQLNSVPRGDVAVAQELEQQMTAIEQMVKRKADDYGVSVESPVTVASDDQDSPQRSLIERAGENALDRRSFLRGSAAVASAAAVASTLQMFMVRRAEASERRGFGGPTTVVPTPYGAPVPTIDESTGLALLGLPPGFRYWSYGWTGDPLSLNGPGGPIATPNLHDGMGVLREFGPLAILCRNHETGTGASYVDGRLQYSPFAAGGNTNLLFDMRRKQWLAAWPTLSGTVRNCAGGTTPQGTWLSCEETTTTTVDPTDPTRTFTHGWVFDVPALGFSNGLPIKAMGRRSHEAAAVDPRTGVVYLTEDAGSGGFYRFTPNNRFNYQRGGKLEMLKIAGVHNANLRGSNPLGGNGAPYPVAIGAPLDVEWVTIDDPESVSPSNFAQGAAKGGADFRRPEGAWYGDRSIYWVSTDGGQSGNGMVFQFDIRKQQLILLYDAPSADELDNPDNLVVTPRGGLLFCEDNSGSPSYLLDGISTERLMGLTRDGQLFVFAQNLIDFGASTYSRPDNSLVFTGNYRANEWAGATFSRDGDWLFVNIQTPGVTFAITGPWENGPL
jgi:uncharacterized protein